MIGENYFVNLPSFLHRNSSCGFCAYVTWLFFCSYVQASYARFLWDAEEEEEEEEEVRHEEFEPRTSRMNFFTGPSPITAMS